MSCCDACAMKIDNQSGTTISVSAISTSAGTFRNISVGNTAGNNATLTGNAYSSGGSRGAASGTVTIKVGASSVSFALGYAFNPKNNFGSCPCNASVPSSPLTSGNYMASATTSSSNSSGQASVTWTITAKLASN
ncbi:MAG: hypothetical protein JSR72_17650 [Proteobacteria bacterium]|nr:hypothetical protein [Pseudomonadota bacterium]